MNPVIGNLLQEFIDTQKIKAKDKQSEFEIFSNYIITYPKVPDTFDVDILSPGEGEFGLDGIGIIINEKLIDNEEQASDIIAASNTIDVEFIFCQTKTSEKFDGGDILKFTTAVEDFFGNPRKHNLIPKINEARRVFELILENSNKCRKNLPSVALFYVTTGVWKSDPILCELLDKCKERLDEKAIFGSVNWSALGAKEVQRKYTYSKNSISVTATVGKNITLPPIPNVKESYLAIISAVEFLKIITEPDGSVRKSLFFDNIRDFDPKSEINKKIGETIRSGQNIEFPIRNNGITIVTRYLQRVGDNFTLEDFQIVNGCQTSHVLQENAQHLTDAVQIPIKIICTDDEEVTARVIISSNQQNEVNEEMFWSLKSIHKDIEIFMSAKAGDLKLFYERRAGQYNADLEVEKVRIITKESLLKSYASMFLDEANKVGRHYGDLIPMVGQSIFKENDKMYPYYTAGYSSFRLEWLFRNNRIDKKYKPFRFQMLMAARLIVQKENQLNEKDKYSSAYCDTIDKVMQNIDDSTKLFQKTIDHINHALKDIGQEDEITHRVSKMRDTRDALRRAINESPQNATLESA
jgi:hypothetical protein